MRIFEYPFVIITILVFILIVLAFIGIIYALKGIKATNDREENDFVNINKLEGFYNKLTIEREKRCVLYVSISLENIRSLYSASKAWQIYSEIKPIFLNLFSNGKDAFIADYESNNFVSLSKWNKTELKVKINICMEEIHRCLLRHNAVNTLEVCFGSFPTMATSVCFVEALNRAKQACGIAEKENTLFEEWNNTKGKAFEKKVTIENNIESEIDKNRFFLEYQPFIKSSDKKIAGVEVLSRLNSENEGILTPGSFLAAVNSVGISDKFDYYIFEKNCKWISNNKEQRGKYIYSINFSRETLCESDFSEMISEIVEKYNLDYSCIAIEILEDKAITESMKNQMVKNLTELREKGVLMLLDDFGSGYTSFGDLQNFKIDIVKVDKSITQGANDETGFLILKNIIRTAKDLGLKTVCEGIETEEHENAAIKAGCDYLQGYYYYRPMPVARLEQTFLGN